LSLIFLQNSIPRESQIKYSDKIQKAQLMLPLHLRKSNAEKNIFGVFFREMVSIKLVDGLDIFKQEAKCLFVQLIANEHIRNIIRGFQRNKWFRF
jgi:hypothetical protein